ncbi:MAG: response regulator transcription factor [Ignavibacteriales bacterium]|nr:response regulator transcription factor [Ignavibacteriales bacterium]MCF8316571.1 response regulator transcription factor [Ignavibacteriales bacterium]MCF8437494.1 response regulator transcription factor [Ignavibacteriales bacterium]
MIRLLIADDHPIFLLGLRQVIESSGDFTVIEQVNSGDKALKFLQSNEVDIAVLDLDMPGLNGFEITKELAGCNKHTNIIFLTMHKAKDLLTEALNLGVKGYVLKETSLSEIEYAIRKVHSGGVFISSECLGDLLPPSKFNNDKDYLLFISERLSPTEKIVLHYIAQNKDTKEIAGLMFISPRTVEKHRSNICSKLGITGNNALLKFALENKDFLSKN